MPKKKIEIDLEWKAKNTFETYCSPQHEQAMSNMADSYIDFLSTAKTERETVAFAVRTLDGAGFEADNGHTPPKAPFYRILRDKSLCVVVPGKRPLADGLRLIGAHADAPRIDFKQRPLYEDCALALAKTHYYGGIRKHQWTARPLAMHGVIALTDGRLINVVVGENPDDPVLTIADLLPHLAYKQAEQKLSEAYDAEKLNVVLGHKPGPKQEGDCAESKDACAGSQIKRNILQILGNRFGIREADLFSAELAMVPAGPARYVGLDRALIGGYAHDDRICCFASLEAALSIEEPEHTVVAILWDKEEIGSEGNTSARSLALQYLIEDMVDAWEPQTKLRRVFEQTKAISADVHGALDPDYQDCHEKLNAAVIGYGPCFSKFTGHRGKVGANDAHPEYVAWLRRMLDTKGIPWQMAELGKVDLGGGGTVAKFLAVYGMDIIDFGPAVLSMHSPFELASTGDLYATYLAYKAFLES